MRIWRKEPLCAFTRKVIGADTMENTIEAPHNIKNRTVHLTQQFHFQVFT